MKTSVVFRSPSESHGLYAANDTDQSFSEDKNKDDKNLSPAHATKVYCDEPFSSSPYTSPRTVTSSRTANETGAYNQDSEPVPFSSTPDLGSRTASSSPNADYDSQLLVTPPEEKFIRTLDRKLQALVNAQNLEGSPFSPYVYQARLRGQDEASQTSASTRSAVEYDATPLSLSSTGSRSSMKRKWHEPPTRDTSVGHTETTADEDSGTDYEDDATLSNIPVSKKLKETSFNYTVTETASARRARSLSVSSSHDSLVPTEKAASPSPPSTPVYKAPAVPIIAPPEFHAIPRPPLSPDDAAEGRLKALLQRERMLRKQEGFEKGISDIFDSPIAKEQVDELLGIDEDFRKEVIAWMLRITPGKKLGVDELRHQLRTCPETRFHAILLFTRYFMRVGDAMPIATERETPLMRLGRKRITWDVAMSCLALAVKFHRDFLNPFSPVYSRDFLVLAPHPMSHDDFEISQKDVLQALNYDIRDITPGPFMQEIWNSLPSLRKLLTFPDGWEITQLNAWQILNAAATASEMLQFPISLLTAGAIVEGAVVALIEVCEQVVENRTDEEVGKEARKESETMIADVVMDIRELMNISSTDMKRCRRWIQKIIEVTY